MDKVFHMNAGRGESSYANNSSLFQKTALMLAKPLLEESISGMKMENHETFCIADLGCSCGPNTLVAAESMVKALHTQESSAPEIQVFFNDLPSNDFNSVFESLCEGAGPSPSFFAAGVPGSFHRRHSAFRSLVQQPALAFPEEVVDRNNEAWNKGKVFISLNGPPAISQAYLRQFQKDFNAFLTARAEELRLGGRMFLLLLGREPNSDPRDQGHQGLFWDALGNALNDLVLQGVVEGEKVDSFNLPLFAPSPEEVRNAVVAQGSFSIKRLEILNAGSPLQMTENAEGEGKQMGMKWPTGHTEYGRFLAMHVRALSESLLQFQFGAAAMDPLFDRFAHIIAEMAKDGDAHVVEREHLLVVVLQKQNSASSHGTQDHSRSPSATPAGIQRFHYQ